MTTEPLFIGGPAARQLVGFGIHKFRRLVRDGVIPSWTDPETGHRYYSRLALEEWARNNGQVA